MNPSEVTRLGIDDVYTTTYKIGSGSFGQVYAATNNVTGEEVAIKTEMIDCKYPQLRYESKIYRELRGESGITNIHFYGEQDGKRILIMDRLGPSLEDRLITCGGRFSLQTVLILAEHLLNIIEMVHSHGIVHRDIKPENFMFGMTGTPNESLLYIIDFGLSKQIFNPKTQQHIRYNKNKCLTGTPRYASIRNHKGREQSRRDDLESIGYMLIYFLRGTLPWQSTQFQSKRLKNKNIMTLKQEYLKSKKLFSRLPREFEEYFDSILGLGFEQRPDYRYLRSIFRALYRKLPFSDMPMLDWDHIQNQRESFYNLGKKSRDDYHQEVSRATRLYTSKVKSGFPVIESSTSKRAKRSESRQRTYID